VATDGSPEGEDLEALVVARVDDMKWEKFVEYWEQCL